MIHNKKKQQFKYIVFILVFEDLKIQNTLHSFFFSTCMILIKRPKPESQVDVST